MQYEDSRHDGIVQGFVEGPNGLAEQLGETETLLLLLTGFWYLHRGLILASEGLGFHVLVFSEGLQRWGWKLGACRFCREESLQ